MKYRYLGRSGLKVARVCLGTMTFGEPEWGCGEATSIKIIDKYLSMGGNFIDTANVYNKGLSEEFTGKGLKGRRQQVILATKVFFPVMDGPNGRGLSRKHIIDSCEASLKRLGTDYIDLYQAHGPDLRTPMEETMSAFEGLIRQGKVRYLGCSNYHAWQIMKACAMSERSGLTQFISAQHLYNLIFRDVEREIIPVCKDQGLGMIPWSPLAGGLLSGKYKKSDAPPPGSRMALRAKYDQKRYWNERGFGITEAVASAARDTGHTPAQVSLSWLLHDKQVSSVIIGTRDPLQLDDTLVSGDWDLPEEQWTNLDKAAPFDHGYPQSWQDMMHPQMYGDIEC